MTKWKFTFFILIITLNSFGQINKNLNFSKGQIFVNSGRIKVFNFYGGSLKSSILEPNRFFYRVVEIDGIKEYFLRIEQTIDKEEYSTNIPFEELDLFISEIKNLRTESDQKVGYNSVYGFNSYISPSGGEVGYIISENNAYFYVMTRKGNLFENTMKIKNVKELEESFITAKQEIERIKNQ